MAKASPARRQNRLIGLVVALLLIVAGVSAVAVNPGTSAPADSTVASGSDHSADPHHLLRPADISLTWFYHSLSVEQFDYNMSSLSCSAMAKYITVDLCAVAKSANGNFMVVGTEGYWDPEEPNSSGVVKVPMDLTVYVLTSENGPTRAMSVLDGSVSMDYDGDAFDLVAYVVDTPGGQVLALHKRPSRPSASSYAAWDELQVLAVSPSGAPTVVATYEGSNIHVAGDGPGLVFSSDRYASPSGSSSDPMWSTYTYLYPGSEYPYAWTETMRSGKGRLIPGGSGKPVVADTYEFPNSGVSKGADA